MSHCMVGNWMGNSMMGDGVGHGRVGHSMVSNWMGHGMGDRVSQEANTMVCWRMVDSRSHPMVGSVVNRWSSMVHNRGSMVHNRGSMMHNRGSMVHNRGSMMHNRGSMMHSRSSITRSLIIDCLSSVSHFLDH